MNKKKKSCLSYILIACTVPVFIAVCLFLGMSIYSVYYGRRDLDTQFETYIMSPKPESCRVIDYERVKVGFDSQTLIVFDCSKDDWGSLIDKFELSKTSVNSESLKSHVNQDVSISVVEKFDRHIGSKFSVYKSGLNPRISGGFNYFFCNSVKGKMRVAFFRATY